MMVNVKFQSLPPLFLVICSISAVTVILAGVSGDSVRGTTAQQTSVSGSGDLKDDMYIKSDTIVAITRSNKATTTFTTESANDSVANNTTTQLELSTTAGTTTAPGPTLTTNSSESTDTDNTPTTELMTPESGSELTTSDVSSTVFTTSPKSTTGPTGDGSTTTNLTDNPTTSTGPEPITHAVTTLVSTGLTSTSTAELPATSPEVTTTDKSGSTTSESSSGLTTSDVSSTDFTTSPKSTTGPTGDGSTTKKLTDNPTTSANPEPITPTAHAVTTLVSTGLTSTSTAELPATTPEVTTTDKSGSTIGRDSSEDISASELELVIGVCFASLLLILAAFVILAATLVVVVRNRRKSDTIVNMNTVHNSAIGISGDNESNTESIPEQVLVVEEGTNNNAPSLSIHDDKLDRGLEQCTVFERENENDAPKLDLSEDVMNGGMIVENGCIELTTISETEPAIVGFESLVKAKAGEQVTLSVSFIGTPKPTITWTFKGNKMEGDYATELGTAGSLMFFCVESKHAGKYDFEVTNYLGSAQGSVTLVVEEDDISTQNSKDVVKITNSFESNPIDQEKFGEYVAGLYSLNNEAFEIQYTSLLSGEEGKQVSVGKSDNYRCLNRFKNITAYDDCRVVLEPIIGHPDYQHDYINASYVDGFSQAKMFIATQGPLSHTIVDFWRLVWQEKVNVIAMVTNLREGMKVKCEQYWPEQGHNMQLGPYIVTIVEQQCFPYYIIRKFLLKCTAGIVGIEFSREIIQYHYTSWPDHGVPECPGPILDYLRRVKSGYTPDNGPILIHCSAGVGRTGTLMAIDIALSQASKERQVDIPKIIVNMRRQRMKMVQNANQYAFIHDAVLEALVCGDTRIPASDLHQTVERLRLKDDENEGKTGFEKQFAILEQVSLNPQEITRRAALMHSDKNRSNDFLPPDKSRVRLKGRSPGQDYIHASYIHSYKQKNGFIIAQSPMENTLVDFVKMLYERECGVVVMLCGCEEGGVEVCAQYWPEGEGTTLQHGEMLVSTEKVTKTDGVIQRVITITDSKSDEGEHEVTLFQVDQWNEEGVGECSNVRALIDVLNKMRDLELQKSTGNKPVIVHGSDTVSQVGVFCSLVNAIEMCKTEGVVDVFQVVKALRIQKPGAVPTMNQYSFIFDLVLTFLEPD